MTRNEMKQYLSGLDADGLAAVKAELTLAEEQLRPKPTLADIQPGMSAETKQRVYDEIARAMKGGE